MKHFLTEIKEEISSKDFLLLRTLYQPIIGLVAASFYELLVDCHKINKFGNFYLETSFLKKVLNLNTEELKKARTKLEAVGLIRTFEKSDNKHFIIVVNKPLEITHFKKNSFLLNQLIKKIGHSFFEKIEFSIRKRFLPKSEFKEITTKFQDVFNISSVLKSDYKYDSDSNGNFDSTIEIDISNVKDRDEAIKLLSPGQFLFYLSKKRIKPGHLHLIESLKKLGFSSESINLMFDYSFEINGKLIVKHVEVISNDFFTKKIIEAEDVREELKNALKFRKDKIENETKKISWPLTSEEDLEWNDILKQLGDF